MIYVDACLHAIYNLWHWCKSCRLDQEEYLYLPGLNQWAKRVLKWWSFWFVTVTTLLWITVSSAQPVDSVKRLVVSELGGALISFSSLCSLAVILDGIHILREDTQQHPPEQHQPLEPLEPLEAAPSDAAPMFIPPPLQEPPRPLHVTPRATVSPGFRAINPPSQILLATSSYLPINLSETTRPVTHATGALPPVFNFGPSSVQPPADEPAEVPVGVASPNRSGFSRLGNESPV